jgi:TetR/AcrR family transcriptional repressor of nem operon
MGMRYGVNHKRRSRARILDSAAQQFRANGREAVRVADVMQAAGLTPGGFYKHFADKDQLFREAVKTSLEQTANAMKAVAQGVSRPEALKKVIATYLSEEHMSHPDFGCALAALGTEMARTPPEMKRAISEGLDAFASRLDFLMPGETAAQRRAAFLVLFPSMAGCIMAARAHADKDRQRQILSAGRAFFGQAFCGNQSPAILETME